MMGAGRIFLVVFLLLYMSSGTVHAAAPLHIDLAENHVDITTGFTGTSVVVFGIKGAEGDVAVVLEGPRRDVIVRRKANILGAWINRSWVKFKDIPLYYNYALSNEDRGVFTAQNIGLDALAFQAEDTKGWDEARLGLYKDAFLRGRRALDFYPEEPNSVEFLSERFFKVRLSVPANVPKGEYTVKEFLVRDGEVVHEQRESLKVAQVGFSSDVYEFAQSRSVSYAMVCVFIAVLSGWLSNKIARRS